MQLTAVIVNFVNEDRYVFRRSVLMDAVAEVKYMTSVADRTEIVHHTTGFAADSFFVGEENQRIEVTLQSNLVAC